MSKDIITIQGEANSWYDKVIFVPKKNTQSATPTHLALEAENIIINHMLKICKQTPYTASKTTTNTTKKTTKKNNTFIDSFLYISIACCIISMLYLLIFVM